MCIENVAPAELSGSLSSQPHHEREKGDWQVHADHCIELPRASAMCHADTSSLTTFVWDKCEKPMLSTERPPHGCVDWDGLVASMKYRRLSGEETSNMQNPLLRRG